MVAAPASVSIFAYNALGLNSEPLVLTVGAPAEAGAGESCDALGALSYCGEGYTCLDLCIANDEIDYTCPAEWSVTDLTLDMEVMGDNSTSEITGEASCGGGGPSDVYSFTSTEAGTYNVSSISLTENVDMLLYARSYCSSYQPQFELECNDDYEAFENFSSGIELVLTANETVYLFVDSYTGEAAGDYTITVGAGALPLE